MTVCVRSAVTIHATTLLHTNVQWTPRAKAPQKRHPRLHPPESEVEQVSRHPELILRQVDELVHANLIKAPTSNDNSVKASSSSPMHSSSPREGVVLVTQAFIDNAMRPWSSSPKTQELNNVHALTFLERLVKRPEEFTMRGPTRSPWERKGPQSEAWISMKHGSHQRNTHFVFIMCSWRRCDRGSDGHVLSFASLFERRLITDASCCCVQTD